MMFWSGVTYSILVMGLWSFHQTSLFQPWLPPVLWLVPYPQAHGFMMVYGVLGFYFCGFLLTTFPRWLDQPEVARSEYILIWFLLSLGAHLFWVGLFAGSELSAAGVFLFLGGLAVAVRRMGLILLASTSANRYQQVMILFGLTSGLVGLSLYGAGITLADPVLISTVRPMGVYLFLLPVVLGVIHRMVPFFTSTVTPNYEVRRWAPALLIYALLLSIRSGLELRGLSQWSMLSDLPMALVLGIELAMWRFWRADRRPLLLVLYMAMAWLWLSFLVSGLESVVMVFRELPVRPFGHAAMHMMTVGGLGTLLLGISTRVTLGHSGQGLATDRLTALLFYLFQLVPLMRIAPEIAGYWIPTIKMHSFWSGWGWVLVFGVWFLAFGRVLTQPRSDGRPG